MASAQSRESHGSKLFCVRCTSGMMVWRQCEIAPLDELRREFCHGCIPGGCALQRLAQQADEIDFRPGHDNSFVDDVFLESVEIVADIFVAVESCEINLILLEPHLNANAGTGEANENVIGTRIQKIMMDAILFENIKKIEKAGKAGFDVHDESFRDRN